MTAKDFHFQYNKEFAMNNETKKSASQEESSNQPKKGGCGCGK